MLGAEQTQRDKGEAALLWRGRWSEQDEDYLPCFIFGARQRVLECLTCCSCFYRSASFHLAAFENPAWRAKEEANQVAKKQPNQGFLTSLPPPLSCLTGINLLIEPKEREKPRGIPFPQPPPHVQCGA